MGFEPTCPCGQLHFECSSLQPLRYASVYKYSLFGTNHMISSQSRYDHFDTAPYLSQHQHLGKRGELMGRTSKNIKLRIPEKPHKIKGFRSGSYRVATTISSLLFNCDGGARFGVVSVSPVPAEIRLKSGFFAQKVLRDGLF